MSLGVTPGWRVPSKVDAHALGPALDQRLRRQHMDHLGGADAEGDGAHAAVGAGVAVAAHQQGAGQGDALLGPDDVDDALAGLAQVEQLYAPALGLGAHVVQALGVGLQRVVGAAGLGRDDMVEGGEGEIGIAHRLARALDHGEAAAAAVMHQMAADVQERVVVAEIGDDMTIPDLVEEGLSRHGISFRRGRCRADRHTIILLRRRQRSSAEGKTAARLGARRSVALHDLPDRRPPAGIMIMSRQDAGGPKDEDDYFGC